MNTGMGKSGNVDKPVPLIAETGQVEKGLRQEPCPHCGAALSTRKAAFAKDEHIVHSRCLDKYEAFVKEADRIARVALKEAEQAKIKAEHDANKERRGTCLDQYCTYEKKNIFENGTSKEAEKEWFFFDEILQKLRRAGDTIIEFTGDLSKPDADCAYYMSWSGKAFEAAATIRVCSRINSFFEGGLSVAEIKAICEEEIFRAARSTSQSTSPVSNLMEREVLAAWTNARSRW